jgi:hypothetical protein
MKAYINYLDPHITIHRNPECSEIHKHRKPDQRIVAVTPQSLRGVLSDFANNKYKFAASSEYNDLWLDISLGSPQHNESAVYIIQTLLGLHYKPFENASINRHCSSV